jgi:hypothetical protein
LNLCISKFGATNVQGIMRRLACYADILKGKIGSLFHQIVILVFFNLFSGTRASPPVLLGIGDDDLDDALTVEGEMPPP